MTKQPWTITSETVRYGVRYTRGENVDVLDDGMWQCRSDAAIHAVRLLHGTDRLYRLNDADKATSARVVKITKRWKRRAKKVKP